MVKNTKKNAPNRGCNSFKDMALVRHGKALVLLVFMFEQHRK